MTGRASKRLKISRIGSQILFAAAFLYVFARSRDPFSVVANPFLQWDPIMGANGPIFMHRIELQNLVAVLECTSREMIPKRFQNLERARLVSEIQQLKVLMGEREEAG